MRDLIIFLILIALGFTAGTITEKRHYRSIRKREKELLHLPAVTIRKVEYPDEIITSAQLVYGNAVISTDYFKKFLAGLRTIFGGAVKSYESLIDRARREAVLRMKEMAPDASVIVNVRVETSTIGLRANRKSVGCLEAIAYGTALTLDR